MPNNKGRDGKVTRGKPFSKSQRQALQSAVMDRLGMSQDDAKELVKTISKLFQGAEEIADETLEPQTRSIFYDLEAIRVLGHRREVGKEIHKRFFFWHIRWDNLQVKAKKPAGEDDVYAKLPASAWAHGTKPAN